MTPSRPFVFVSSPKDMAEYRDTIKMVHLELDAATGGLAFDLYRWEEAFERTPPTDELPPQAFINDRVVAAECRAVIGILGESLGHDSKPDAAMLDRLSFAARPDKTKSGMVHPWPAPGSPEANDALQSGCFPLTGTSGEILLAIQAGKPLRVFFIGTGNVLAAEKLEEVKFGNDAMLNRRQSETAADKASQRKYAAWLHTDYYPGLWAVRNFLRFLNDRYGWYPNEEGVRQKTEDFARAIRRFYRLNLAVKTAPRLRDVFKGLSSYDIDDKDVFFGRSTWTGQRLAEFRELDADPARASLMAVTGPSGSGKSSAMRAGLAAHLRDVDGFKPVILMPDELTASDPGPALASMIRRICRILEKPFDVEERTRFIGVPAALLPTAAANVLVEALRQGTGRPLLLLDQFDVLALRATDDKHPTVLAVMAFLRAVLDPATRSRVGVLCTIGDQHENRLADSYVFGPLMAKGAVARLLRPTRDELLEVIRRPFEVWGAPMDGPARELLRSALDVFLGDTSAEGDALPLVSLQLTRLYGAIRSDIDKRIRRLERLPEASSSTTLIRERDIVGRIDFSAVIDDVASKAVEAARARLGVNWDEDELDSLFDRLIELRSPAGTPDGGTRPLLLKSERLPERLTTAREAAVELTKEHLLVDLGRARYKLVHEVVVRQWSRFDEWLARRELTLQMIRALRPLHELYAQQQAGDRRATLEPFTSQALQAARILHDFVEVLGPDNDADLGSEMRARRDFYLDLIAAHPLCGRELIESKDREPDAGVRTTPVVHIVARYRRADVMRELLTQDPSLVHSVRLPEGRSVLVPATVARDRATVSLLLERGADPLLRESGGEGWTPILASAYVGDVDLFDEYVRRGADPLERLNSGWNAPQIAAYWNRPQLLQHIIDTVDPDRMRAALVTRDGDTVAHVAARRGHVEVLAVVARTHPSLLDAPSGGGGPRPLFLAASGGQLRAATWLAARSDVDIDALVRPAEGGSALIAAADLSAGAGDMVEALLQSGRADPNVRGWPSAETALHRAARTGNLSAARRLLAHPRIDPNARDAGGETPVFGAVARQHSTLVELLLADERVEPFIADNTGRTVLLLAHEQEERTLVQSLLRRLPGDTEHSEPNGWTPLLIAASHGLDDERDRFLRGRGQRELNEYAADDNVWSCDDLVSIAVRRGGVDFLRGLLADPRLRPTPAWSLALCEAARRPNRLAELGVLLQDGRFDIDAPIAPSAHGAHKRPIHYAAITGNVEGVRLLIDAGGVTPDPLDGWQRRPVDLAPASVRQVIRGLTHGPGAQSGSSPDAVRETVAGDDPPSGSIPAEPNAARRTESLDPGPADEEELNAAERSTLLARVSSADRVLDFTLDGTVFRKRRYPLYPACMLVEISNPRWLYGPYVRVYLVVVGDLLSGDATILRLDGTSAPIHRLNAMTHLRLRPESAIDYLKFFCFFVWGGDSGPFYVIPEEGAPSHIAEDTNVDPGESGEYGTLRDLYRPPAFHGQAGDGSLRASALVYYDDAIFFAEFLIQPNGEIRMVEDEPLITGLGVKVDVPAPAVPRRRAPRTADA